MQSRPLSAQTTLEQPIGTGTGNAYNNQLESAQITSAQTKNNEKRGAAGNRSRLLHKGKVAPETDNGSLLQETALALRNPGIGRIFSSDTSIIHASIAERLERIRTAGNKHRENKMRNSQGSDGVSPALARDSQESHGGSPVRGRSSQESNISPVRGR